jgi:hypothetical protein
MIVVQLVDGNGSAMVCEFLIPREKKQAFYRDRNRIAWFHCLFDFDSDPDPDLDYANCFIKVLKG